MANQQQQGPQGFQPYRFFPGSGGLRDMFARTGLTAAQQVGDTPYVVPTSPLTGGYTPQGPHMRDVQNWDSTQNCIDLMIGWNTVADSGAHSDPVILIFTTAPPTGSTTPQVCWMLNTGYFFQGTATGAGGTVTSSTMPNGCIRANVIPFQGKFIFTTPSISANVMTGSGLWEKAGNGNNDAPVKVGVPVPTALTTAVGAAGALTGTYLYEVTFVNSDGHESNPSPSASVVLAAQRATLTNIPVWSGSQTAVTKRNIYRTTAGGGTLLFLTQIADNVTTTLTDNAVDSTLGSAVVITNDIPPDDIVYVSSTSTRVAALQADGKSLWFSKIDSNTGLSNWEAFPAALQINIPFSGSANISGNYSDVGSALVFFQDSLYVFGNLNTYRVQGDIGSGVKVEKIFPDVGIFWPHSWVIVPDLGLVFLDQNRRLRLWDGASFKFLDTEIVGLLEHIKPPAGLFGSSTPIAGPTLSFDPLLRHIFLDLPLMYGTGYTDWSGNTSTAPISSNVLAYCLNTNEWMAMAWTSYYSIWSPQMQQLIWADYRIRSVIRGWWGANSVQPNTVSYQYNGGYNVSFFRYHPWTPAPMYDIDFGWIDILIEAKPIVSNVLPMLKVSYALDGSETFVDKYVDYSRDYITRAGVTDSVLRTVRVPVNRTARTITLQISTVANAASMSNGVQIYGISIYARPLRLGTNTSNVFSA